jgi:predicted RNA binding protein YcfA (HicA-like mRNA interferase family)
VVKILEDNGFKEVRSSKHITFKKKLPGGRVLTTWVPHHREVTVFVIRYIITQTEKPREEFL